MGKITETAKASKSVDTEGLMIGTEDGDVMDVTSILVAAAQAVPPERTEESAYSVIPTMIEPTGGENMKVVDEAAAIKAGLLPDPNVGGHPKIQEPAVPTRKRFQNTSLSGHVVRVIPRKTLRRCVIGKDIYAFVMGHPQFVPVEIVAHLRGKGIIA